MSERKAATKVPNLRLTEIKLLSLLYRAATTEPSPHDQSEVRLEGSIRYRFYARRKNSFKVRATQEIKAEGVSLRVRHEVRFITDFPISNDLFGDETFQTNVVNMILPFGSELFAVLTGKTLDIPLIAPGELARAEEIAE